MLRPLRRSAIFLVAVIVTVAAALSVAPGRVVLGRAADIGPKSAYPGLALPLTRRVIFTDKPFPPWVARITPDGRITVLREIRDTWPAERYERTIVHEYGHGLLDDVISDGHPLSYRRVRLYERVSSTPQSGTLPEAGVPTDVRAVFAVFRQAEDDIYASEYWKGAMATHYTDAFGEFFAESFARWRAGDEVDPAIEKALTRLTAASR